MMKDDLGDRMKFYERSRTLSKLEESSPFVYARIDGRGFSKFTRGMNKPFDESLKKVMISVTENLVKKTHAIAGYTQSDEISLAWNRKNLFFDGKIQKICSILSGMATSHFIVEGLKTEHCDRVIDKLPHFDARVFEISSEDEIANAFLWRYNDCHRNAIQSIAHANFSHKKLQNKSVKDLESMLASIGVFKYDFPSNSLHGTIIKRTLVEIEGLNGTTFRDALEQISVNLRDYSHEERKGIIFNK